MGRKATTTRPETRPLIGDLTPLTSHHCPTPSTTPTSPIGSVSMKLQRRGPAGIQKFGYGSSCFVLVHNSTADPRHFWLVVDA
ncbi:hypothetical protein E2C01_011592 [Portunus trituberculatus]|uniref:Uncharacterized protein n=1 Tax=Portunus trituberculatus TaxID=210409 RepID=A0A5B7DBE7_PORTR|nr:hypothetical protein [Portunus trituberculatus]